MTVAELHAAFNTKMQQVGSHINDDFLFDEIDYYLNSAQRTLVVAKLRGESSQFDIEDLRPLITETTLSNFVTTGTEAIADWPADFIHLLGSRINITRTANPVITPAEYVEAGFSTEDELPQIKTTTENKPYLRYPRLVVREDAPHIFCDYETTMSGVKVTYVRYPVNMTLDETDDNNNVEPELPEHLHEEMLNIAIQMAQRDLNLKAEDS